MAKFIIILLISLMSLHVYSAEENVIEFRIQDGTEEGSWNDDETSIEASLGDIIRFINDDTIDHRLHTNGSPCPHGPNIEPGESWDCLVEQDYSSELSGPLYDHYVGPSAEVWIEILTPSED